MEVIQKTGDDVHQTPLVELSELVKTYGSTVAVDKMSLIINKGEAVGLIGANGAGKSTLIKMLSGVTAPDSGMYRFSGDEIDLKTYSSSAAQKLGIRVVFQELSLCTNLSVYENFYIELHQWFNNGKWKKKVQNLAKESLDKVFPGHGIDVAAKVGSLPIAQRQMVEIARAFADTGLKCLILDEPTSSLGSEQSAQLHSYIAAAKREGMSFVYISHRLGEVCLISDQIVVMQNGRLSWKCAARSICEAELIEKMGGMNSTIAAVKNARQEQNNKPNDTGTAGIKISHLDTDELHDINMKFYPGEIVGIAGLEGSGQRALLHALYQAKDKKKSFGGICVNGKIAYVSGDRAKEGVFPYWSIKKNATITKLMRKEVSPIIDGKKEAQWVDKWYQKLHVKSAGSDTLLTSLSGGNQQKILIARALLSDADCILLDDPTRGVDVETKKQLYTLFREAVDEGKIVIWYSTEDDELTECDRIYVLRSGYLVRELPSVNCKDEIIEASFIPIPEEKDRKEKKEEGKIGRSLRNISKQRTFMPLVAMIIIFILMGMIHPHTLSFFGLTLLLTASLPLVLATVSQMFIVGCGDIDLGLGAYIGLVNVISATILMKNPLLGIVLILLGILGYAVIGTLIQIRKLPSIVVTLGSSFVWLGLALMILAVPGGQSPQWLMAIFDLSVPVIPEPIILAAIIGGLAYWILFRTRYGMIIRGFGNNPQSIARSGWSLLKARIVIYMLAAFFATLAGLSLTGITTAADANGATTYTMLTVAAVVLGGCELTGGAMAPYGVIFGAITLSSIGSLLGFLNVSSTYQSAVQGLILFAILAARLMVRRKA